MSSWRNIYKSKLVSIDDAVKIIAPNQRIFLGYALSGPQDLIEALGNRLPELGFTHIISSFLVRPYKFLMDPEMTKYYRYSSIFPFVVERQIPNVEIYSYHFSQTDWLVENVLKPDVLMIECSPPDDRGYMNFGPSGVFNNYILARYASQIIVQVNSRVPYVYGKKNLIHVSEVDAIAEKDHELFELPSIPVTDVERKIAELITERIEDGSTLQIGIGGLANAIASFLDSKKDLGIHTEMLTDAVVELAKKGVVNGKRKTLHPGEITFSFAGGNRETYDFLDRNPVVGAYPISYINNVNVIAKNDNFVSVNGALMVDLTGQVASESLGFRQFSGTGGQVDFVRGANMAKNGKSFIALPSTAKTEEGIVSRIVLQFPPGQVVTTPRSDVMNIVTEYGVAELKGKSIPERVKAMIAIAHPQFRDELTAGAKKVGLLY